MRDALDLSQTQGGVGTGDNTGGGDTDMDVSGLCDLGDQNQIVVLQLYAGARVCLCLCLCARVCVCACECVREKCVFASVETQSSDCMYAL